MSDISQKDFVSVMSFFLKGVVHWIEALQDRYITNKPQCRHKDFSFEMCELLKEGSSARKKKGICCRKCFFLILCWILKSNPPTAKGTHLNLLAKHTSKERQTNWRKKAGQWALVQQRLNLSVVPTILLISSYQYWCFIQLLESPIPAAAAPSQKASSDDISGTKRGTIDPLVSKRPEKNLKKM